jgi:hypothetical protein
MCDRRLVLKRGFIFVGALWTGVIVVNVLRDLCRPESNHFGIFFAVLVALALVLLGNGVLTGFYFLLRRFLE